jgi:hypothetical protein
MASHCSGLNKDGNCPITKGSAFSAAKGARSDWRYCRSTRGEVACSIRTVFIVSKIRPGFGWATQTGWMSQEMDPPLCATCGRMPQDTFVARLTWALGREEGRPVWTCDLCCREHLRSIEGKLHSTWW